jgi:hypothetical protein
MFDILDVPGSDLGSETFNLDTLARDFLSSFSSQK